MPEAFDPAAFRRPESERSYWRYKFAGMAMQGLLSNSNSDFGQDAVTRVAYAATRYTDALLAELEKVDSNDDTA